MKYRPAVRAKIFFDIRATNLVRDKWKMVQICGKIGERNSCRSRKWDEKFIEFFFSLFWFLFTKYNGECNTSRSTRAELIRKSYSRREKIHPRCHRHNVNGILRNLERDDRVEEKGKETGVANSTNSPLSSDRSRDKSLLSLYGIPLHKYASVRSRGATRETK